MLTVITVVCLLLTFVLPFVAIAAEKDSQQNCSLQLAEKTVQAKNLDDERDAKEQKIASLQVQIYLQNQTIKALDDQIKKMSEKPSNGTDAVPLPSH